MVNRLKFYINGAWVDPVITKTMPLINPASAQQMFDVALGSKADVDKAVIASRLAFEDFSNSSREHRILLLSRIIEIYKRRLKEIGEAISDEMGAPFGSQKTCKPNPVSATS